MSQRLNEQKTYLVKGELPQIRSFKVFLLQLQRLTNIGRVFSHHISDNREEIFIDLLTNEKLAIEKGQGMTFLLPS